MTQIAQSEDGCTEKSVFTQKHGLSDPCCNELITKLHFMQFWHSITQLKSHLNPLPVGVTSPKTQKQPARNLEAQGQW